MWMTVRLLSTTRFLRLPTITFTALEGRRELGATERRTGLGLKDRGSTEIEVEPDPGA